MCLYVVGRHRWRGLSIGVELWRLWENDLKKKNECARWIECRGRGRGGRVHAREKVSSATKVRGLCGCKRLTNNII